MKNLSKAFHFRGELLETKASNAQTGNGNGMFLELEKNSQNIQRELSEIELSKIWKTKETKAFG